MPRSTPVASTAHRGRESAPTLRTTVDQAANLRKSARANLRTTMHPLRCRVRPDSMHLLRTRAQHPMIELDERQALLDASGEDTAGGRARDHVEELVDLMRVAEILQVLQNDGRTESFDTTSIYREDA